MTVVKMYKKVITLFAQETDLLVGSIEDVKKACVEWMKKREAMGERWIASCEQRDKYEVIRELCDEWSN